MRVGQTCDNEVGSRIDDHICRELRAVIEHNTGLREVIRRDAAFDHDTTLSNEIRTAFVLPYVRNIRWPHGRLVASRTYRILRSMVKEKFTERKAHGIPPSRPSVMIYNPSPSGPMLSLIPPLRSLSCSSFWDSHM